MTAEQESLRPLTGWLTRVHQTEGWRERPVFRNGGLERNVKKSHYPMYVLFIGIISTANVCFLLSSLVYFCSYCCSLFKVIYLLIFKLSDDRIL